MAVILSFMNNPSTFDQYDMLREERPEVLILFPTTKIDDTHNKIKENVEKYLGINTIIAEFMEESFSTYLKKFYEIIMESPDNQYLFIGTGAPVQALMAAIVLGTFFDIRIEIQDNSHKFTIPNQNALSLIIKKQKILKVIQEEEPESLENLLDILLERKILNGTKKNMRAKISYILGILQKSGLVSTNRGERGKLKIYLTSIGSELLNLF